MYSLLHHSINDDVAEHANLETHFIDSSGLIFLGFIQNTPDYEFVDWDFSGSTQEEYENLMAIFNAEEKEVYIMDYNHLDVHACRIIVPGSLIPTLLMSHLCQ